MSKVTVVGAGNVGATCANVLAFNEVADEVVMLDVKEGVSEGKAMDMMQTAQLLGFDTNIVGCTNDYEKTANSDVVVITSGIPRKPGMTREELIGVNAGIVKSVAQNILKYSPNAIIVTLQVVYSIGTTTGIQRVAVRQERFGSQAAEQGCHSSCIIGTQVCQVSGFAEMDFNGSKAIFQRKLLDACPFQQAFHFIQKIGCRGGTQIRVVYFCFFHVFLPIYSDSICKNNGLFPY